ncbi:hypothetical protein [Clostridium gasigenes]|uniref:Uncharacterized protein n=1 Tax=Clostridium gasigenes TaxID=94869 RepID=A0A1H0PPC3_9CLOT|nr:hypothetical protein [Clostridium gasigenes]SDP07011.1 hypothetical protein SAMN04488529_10222 [Clostridium gasigenes]
MKNTNFNDSKISKENEVSENEFEISRTYKLIFSQFFLDFTK